MSRLAGLQNKFSKAMDAMKAITEAAGDNSLTPEQEGEYNTLKAQAESLLTQIKTERSRLEMEQQALTVVSSRDPKIEVGEDLAGTDPKGGFKDFGDFASAVFHAGRSGGMTDPRLIGAAATTYGNESVGQDGGYLVPTDFANAIRGHSLENDALLPMCDVNPVSGNSMVFPADETVPWGSDGIRAYWEGEADTATQTKPKLKERTLRLRKLVALVPITDELVEDATALSAYLPKKVGESIRFKVNDAIVNGTGVGMPLGFLQSGALVSVAKEAGQAADTVVAANVAKMYSRNTAPSRAVWLINNDVLPQLLTMTLGNNTVYVPPADGFKNAPGGMLFGRPVIMQQAMDTVGDQGDIAFVDLMAYLAIQKSGGIDFASSIHLWFDQSVTAFRARFRLDGQPWLTSAVTPKNSALTLSPFVVLDARA